MNICDNNILYGKRDTARDKGLSARRVYYIVILVMEGKNDTK